MAVFNWAKWVAEHREPEIAQIVLDWLVKGNYDESVWQARDAIVNLVTVDRQRRDKAIMIGDQVYKAPDTDEG